MISLHCFIHIKIMTSGPHAGTPPPGGTCKVPITPAQASKHRRSLETFCDILKLAHKNMSIQRANPKFYMKSFTYVYDCIQVQVEAQRMLEYFERKAWLETTTVWTVEMVRIIEKWREYFDMLLRKVNSGSVGRCERQESCERGHRKH